MRIARWKNKLIRFARLDGADKWLLLRATTWLAIARIMLVTMPFKRLSARLSVESDSAGAEPDLELLKRIGFAVRVGANHVPWRSDCFPQTIAARMLLKRQGHASTIHIGVERVGDDELAGHAWLTCGETVVIGGGELDRYTELHSLSA
jgi:hypothetical protein